MLVKNTWFSAFSSGKFQPGFFFLIFFLFGYVLPFFKVYFLSDHLLKPEYCSLLQLNHMCSMKNFSVSCLGTAVEVENR